jgi:hypothetical protein
MNPAFPLVCVLALSLLVVAAVFLITSTFQHHGSGRWLAATPAWAGSPDETLKPPTNPPGRASYYPDVTTDRSTVEFSAATVSSRSGRVTWTDRLALAWRFYLASRFRF